MSHLKLFFTEAGVTCEESLRKFPAIDPHIRSGLKGKFKQHQRRHNLVPLICKNFVRRFDRGLGQNQNLGLNELSASDCVYMAQALLDSGVSAGVRDLPHSENEAEMVEAVVELET